MNRVFTLPLFALSLSALSSMALAECDMPAGPIIPDGNVASEDELVRASKAIKMFQESLIGYRNCLAEQEQALDPEAETTDEEKMAILENYNQSVEAEERVAGEFNEAVRAYKARNPSE